MGPYPKQQTIPLGYQYLRKHQVLITADQTNQNYKVIYLNQVLNKLFLLLDHDCEKSILPCEQKLE